MPVQKLVIGNIQAGYETDKKPFLLDNDAFPLLNNAYVWRKRIMRKRGTTQLGRLQRTITSQSAGMYTLSSGVHTFSVFGQLGYSSSQPDASVIPFTASNIGITIEFGMAIGQSLVDGSGIGTLGIVGSGPITAATINYATGIVTITSSSSEVATTVAITMTYYPNLPVMGLEDFEIGIINEPLLVSMDTTYSYGFNPGNSQFYDTTFYKSTHNPFTWNGQNYQQFFSTNYLGVTTLTDSPDKSGCLWATNGVPGFQFKVITGVTLTNPNMSNTTATITVAGNGLSTSDYVFINEVDGITVGSGAAAAGYSGIAGLNGQSGIVTVATTNTFTIAAPYATGNYVKGGIVQYMTSSVTTTQDGIKWYDGDPTSSNNFGWVNFAPPLNAYDPVNLPNPYYLVGANTVIPFKNRLLFSGVYLTTSASGAPIEYYPNRVVYSQVGTPYYSLPLPYPLTLPGDVLPDPTSWYQNTAGKGGFETAPVDQEIVTVAPSADVLLYGMESTQLRLVYTFDDSRPFVFQVVNSELGSQNTFSAVRLDDGILSVGNYGIVGTTQQTAKRIDLSIPDQVFEFSSENNDYERVTAIRDYRNEWVYFTYCPTNRPDSNFNSKTLLFNYRENNWATLDENYTHYGTFRKLSNVTWATVGSIYPTWQEWTAQWNSFLLDADYPNIIGGNQQGFVMIKDDDSPEEDDSQYIQSMTVTSGPVVVTSPDHCLNSGDYINISGIIGITLTDQSGNPINIFQITVGDASGNNLSDDFIIQPGPGINMTVSGVYVGGGVYLRYAVPDIMTKQFPLYWSDGRQVRVGTQRFLLDTTPGGQITVNVYSSQNSNDADNDPVANNYLSFSNIVLTSPEPNNPYSSAQAQIWHRLSNSFNGDSVQLGFTLSNAQMFNSAVNQQEIALHSIILDLYPGPVVS